jgi:apolipoprotein N-acyltransferase
MLDLRLSFPLALLLALVAGGLSALGFAPWSLFPLALAGIALLFWLTDSAASTGRAALVGWLFGVGHFTIGLAWIAKAFTFQAKMPPALGWVAVVGLSMFLALYIALAAGLARAFARDGLARVLALAAAWMLAEWLRGWVLSGFAWNPLGAIWVDVPGIRQLAQFGGALSLSGISVLLGGCLWLAMRPKRGTGDRLAGLALILVLVIAGIAGRSLNRDHYYPDNPLVFVVQPNIGQDVRYVESQEALHFQTYLDMTAGALADARQGENALARQGTKIQGTNIQGTNIQGTIVQDAIDLGTGAAPAGTPRLSEAIDPATARDPLQSFSGATVDTSRGALIIWPEGAVPYAIEEDAGARARLASVLGPNDLLLFGAPAVIRDGSKRVTALTNSLFAIDASGRIRARYDKAHLVPLGEYVPARGVMEQLGLARLTPGDLDFLPGPGPRTLTLPGFPAVGAMICYEIVFPGAVTEPGKRPSWIVNISNDAWFGASGPPQHLAQARLRAIEEGLPIVRATPTGISAIIDGHGNLHATQAPGSSGVLSANLPPPLPATLFARVGHLASLAFGAVLALIGLAIERLRRRGAPAARRSAGNLSVR